MPECRRACLLRSYASLAPRVGDSINPILGPPKKLNPRLPHRITLLSVLPGAKSTQSALALRPKVRSFLLIRRPKGNGSSAGDDVGRPITRPAEKANRVSDFLEIAEPMCIDPLDRSESGGGHVRMRRTSLSLSTRAAVHLGTPARLWSGTVEYRAFTPYRTATHGWCIFQRSRRAAPRVLPIRRRSRRRPRRTFRDRAALPQSFRHQLLPQAGGETLIQPLIPREFMPTLVCPISQSLQNALEKLSKKSGDPISHLVVSSLSRFLDMPHHTLFQVSTSGALVQGIYERAVSSKLLLQHGDFGIGTFEDLDGEMVILEGAIYQARSDGTVTRIVDDVGTPFAVIVPFVADHDEAVAYSNSFQELTQHCNRYRDSNNLFYAFRVDGHFQHVRTRAMRVAKDGLPLARAAAIQPEFDFNNEEGTLIGIWAPQFASAISIAGYHFHFLSADRTKGGHLLACSGSNLRVRVERLNDFHLSLPESAEFLRADLSKDTSKELEYAEQIHKEEELFDASQN
jgi:acetolactate decarboxylase